MPAVTFTAVRTRRTFEEALEQIAERIRHGELSLGDQLPSERLLAAQMQISRPTVREALKVLADSGVLEVKPGSKGGAFVASDYIPRDVLQRRTDLRVAEIGGVLEARRLLEPQVAMLAAMHAREPDFEAMARTIDQQRRCAADQEGFLRREDRFLQLDLQFHLAMARATGNSTIVALMRSLVRRLEIARDMAVHEAATVDWVLDIHERTLAAIRKGDPERIYAVMDEHLAQLEDTWRRESGRARLRELPAPILRVADEGR